jgi:hypothetical protein
MRNSRVVGKLHRSPTSLAPFLLAGILLSALLWFNYITRGALQYRLLAEAFLRGELFIREMPVSGWHDTALFKGYHYWPLGPFPAVLILPLVWLNAFHQGIVMFVITAGVFYLCYRLARISGYDIADALWFAIAFVFATSFVGVAGIAFSWYLAQVVAVSLLFLAIVEYNRARRYWLIGLLIGFATASRPLIVLNAIFFIGAALLLEGKTFKKGCAKLVLFSISLGLVVAALAWYNFARFGSPFETGYTYQILNDGTFAANLDMPGNIAGSLFSPANIPKNFLTFAFGLPDKQAVGTSVFLISPFLIYLCLPARRWELLDWLLAFNICIVMLATLAFRSTGAFQMGYRFTLDYMPFVFWLLMRRRTQLTTIFKTLVLFAVVLDVTLVFYFIATRVG